MARISVNELVPEDKVEIVKEASKAEPAPAHAPTPHHSAPSKRPLKTNKSKLITAGVVLAVIVLVVVVVGVINERNNLKQELNRRSNPETQSQDEAEQLKKEIGQYLLLPTDETPTVATVADASKVRSQSFFTNTENGDKVLLFAKSGKAILYRPSTKKIIEVAPINLNQNQTTETPAETTAPTTNPKTTR